MCHKSGGPLYDFSDLGVILASDSDDYVKKLYDLMKLNTFEYLKLSNDIRTKTVIRFQNRHFNSSILLMMSCLSRE